MKRRKDTIDYGEYSKFEKIILKIKNKSFEKIRESAQCSNCIQRKKENRRNKTHYLKET